MSRSAAGVAPTGTACPQQQMRRYIGTSQAGTLQPPEARSKPGLGSRTAQSKAICRCLLPFGHREDWAIPYTNRVSARVISQLLLKSVDAPACQRASLA